MKAIKERNHPVTANLKTIMEENSLSIDDLSTMSGINKQDLEKMLNDRRVITAEQIVLLAKTLDVEINDLFKKTD